MLHGTNVQNYRGPRGKFV